MALKDITTIEETEQLSADATFYTADGGAFRRAGMDAVKDALGLALESTATKEALLNCFQHVAWIDEHGQDYYDALYDALYNIPVSITAYFEQGSNAIYSTDPLSVLRQYLVVRATYEDDTVQTVTAYTLSGNLTVGTSVITVAYKGRTTTFEVTVSENVLESISAVFTQNGNVFSSSDELDDLKPFLSVTANYSNGTTAPVPIYALSGNLNSATSTITVTYSGKTTTFNVAVSMLPTGYTAKSYVLADGTQYIATSIPETEMVGKSIRYKDLVTEYLDRAGHVFSSLNYFTPYLRWFVTGPGMRFSYNRFNSQDTSYMTPDIAYWEKDREYIIEAFFDGDDIMLDGERMVSLLAGTTMSDSNMLAFFTYGQSPTDTRYRFYGRMYWFKIFDGSTKTHDFVPCVNSSNVAGLYDLVSGTFYAPTVGTLATD